MYMLYVWLAVIAAGLLLEAVEAGTLVTIWFSAGAVIPLIMSFWGITDAWYIILQLIVFCVVTIFSLLYLRRFVRKFIQKNSKGKTNMDMYVGKSFKVSRVDGEIAYIKLNGIEYHIVTEKEEDFELNEKVEIVKIKGNKVIVEKKEKQIKGDK